ncbi:MAG TPA: FAD-binding oxidoreductase [Campylobacterales bacterium]|nr:FAD-binding oxidoreductase [Campylobacterales bacterium]HHS91858.1 FAD-binding oxidoreductase [Campylobacterales bacterium]
MLNKKPKIAIIGGGVAGVTTALHLGQLGVETTLFEKEKTLVTGPPFCHLHAGGNLYREISDAQCITLLKQSIDFLRFYPYVVDYRPTVIALPTTDKGKAKDLILRLELLAKEYQKLIDEDTNNEVLGESQTYYKLYERKELEKLKSSEIVKKPKTLDEWMIPAAQHLDLDKIQYPVVMVQEYGLNLFRLASGSRLALDKMPSITIHTETEVKAIQKIDEQWSVEYQQKSEQKEKESFDYIINASGFRTGTIDDMLNVPCKRMVEFKAAFVSKWQGYEEVLFPEIIIHGERGTPQGMGQFTPYPNGYVQLHGMTNQITLYDDGLVANSPISCQPKLGQNFLKKIEESWSEEETKERTTLAIKHLCEYLPKFTTATVGSKPLFGAQQIPGDDPTLRVAEISFPSKQYARCEIIKVSSSIDMVNVLLKELTKHKILNNSQIEKNKIDYLKLISEEEIQNKALEIAIQRHYPKDLASRNFPKMF